MPDFDLLKMTFAVLYAGVRVGSNSSSDKQKQENILDFLITKFF